MDLNHSATDHQSDHRSLVAAPGHRPLDRPLVSVIVPSYNCYAYLPKAITSIQQQEVKSLQIIILDDGSTDDTWSYLLQLAKADRRIMPIRLVGIGVARARNLGLKLARGRYIAFLDADDYWLANKLSKQIEFHQQHPHASLSFTNYLHIDEQNTDLGDCFDFWPRFARRVAKTNIEHNHETDNGYRLLSGDGAALIFAENVVGTSSVMINPEFLQQTCSFDAELKSAEDWDFWLRLALLGDIGFTPSIGMTYLMRQGTESSRTLQRLESMRTIFARYTRQICAIRPLALLASESRIAAGYAEYYHSINRRFKSFIFHGMALMLAPSKRLARATLADLAALIHLK